jgi:hypothetical protein
MAAAAAVVAMAAAAVVVAMAAEARKTQSQGFDAFISVYFMRIVYSASSLSNSSLKSKYKGRQCY